MKLFRVEDPFANLGRHPRGEVASADDSFAPFLESAASTASASDLRDREAQTQDSTGSEGAGGTDPARKKKRALQGDAAAKDPAAGGELPAEGILGWSARPQAKQVEDGGAPSQGPDAGAAAIGRQRNDGGTESRGLTAAAARTAAAAHPLPGDGEAAGSVGEPAAGAEGKAKGPGGFRAPGERKGAAKPIPPTPGTGGDGTTASSGAARSGAPAPELQTRALQGGVRPGSMRPHAASAGGRGSEAAIGSGAAQRASTVRGPGVEAAGSGGQGQAGAASLEGSGIGASEPAAPAAKGGRAQGAAPPAALHASGTGQRPKYAKEPGAGAPGAGAFSAGRPQAHTQLQPRVQQQAGSGGLQKGGVVSSGPAPGAAPTGAAGSDVAPVSGAMPRRAAGLGPAPDEGGPAQGAPADRALRAAADPQAPAARSTQGAAPSFGSSLPPGADLVAEGARIDSIAAAGNAVAEVDPTLPGTAARAQPRASDRSGGVPLPLEIRLEPAPFEPAQAPIPSGSQPVSGESTSPTLRVAETVLRDTLLQAAEESGVALRLDPGGARLSLRETGAGGIALDLRLHQGALDIKASGTAATLLTSHESDLRAALLGAGLRLGQLSVASADRPLAAASLVEADEAKRRARAEPAHLKIGRVSAADRGPHQAEDPAEARAATSVHIKA